MTDGAAAELSEADDGGQNVLQPRVNRQSPFELHWRKAPPAWRGRVELNYQRLYPHLTVDDMCCVQCGSRPCPVDHEEEEQRKLRDVEFIGTIVAEKNSLVNQLTEMRVGLEEATKQTEAWAVDKESIQRQLTERERTCRMLERERSSLMKNMSRLHSRQGRSADDSRQRTDTSSVQFQTAHVCTVEDKVENQEEVKHKPEALTSQKADIEVIDLLGETSSSTDQDDVELDSPRAQRRRQRKQRAAANFGQLKRRLAESSDRAAQLELQLIKTKDLLDAANKKIIEHSCFADNVEGDRIPSSFPRYNGWRPYARVRGRGGWQAKRDAEQQLRSAASRLEETERTRRELDERLAGAVTELRATHDSRAQLVVDLAARDNELADLRRQMGADRGFRRHVELLRELTEARELNDSLHEQLHAKTGGGDRALATLSADGKLKRKPAVPTTSATARSKHLISVSLGQNFPGPA